MARSIPLSLIERPSRHQPPGTRDLPVYQVRSKSGAWHVDARATWHRIASHRIHGTGIYTPAKFTNGCRDPK